MSSVPESIYIDVKRTLVARMLTDAGRRRLEKIRGKPGMLPEHENQFFADLKEQVALLPKPAVLFLATLGVEDVTPALWRMNEKYREASIKLNIVDARSLAADNVPGWDAPPSPVPQSHVYFFERPNGLIKIGVSGEPLKRLKGLQAQAGASMRMVACMPGERTDEQALHIRFAASRELGEWFRPSVDLTEFIERTRDTVGDPVTVARAAQERYAADRRAWWENRKNLDRQRSEFARLICGLHNAIIADAQDELLRRRSSRKGAQKQIDAAVRSEQQSLFGKKDAN